MANLDIIIRAEDKGASKVIGGISKQVGALDAQASKGFKGLQNAVGAGLLGAAGIGIAGIGALGLALRDSIGLAKIQENAEKQLAAVLKSTGNAAGLTADELKKMASSLQSVTNFGDEAIIQGESLLLTFTGIGKEVFPLATETMLDMSQALGQDMKSSAIQLGKALNDPITGITALSRVGVSFTDQQKEQIKAMQDAGDIAGAQKLILAELAREFGGSARAMADPAIQLSNAWGDFKEVIGAAVLPIINDLATRAMPLVAQATQYMTDNIGRMGQMAQDIWAAVEWIFTGQGANIDWWHDIVDAVNDLSGGLLGTQLEASKFSSMLFDLGSVTQDIHDGFVGFTGAIMEMAKPLTDFLAENVRMSDVLTALGIVIASIIIPAMASVVVAIAPVIAVAAALVLGVAALRTAWETDFGGIREFTAKVMETIWAIIDRVLTLVKRLWQGHGDDTKSFLQDLWKTIEGIFKLGLDNILEALDLVLNILEGDWEAAWQNVLNIAENLWGMLKLAWDGILSQIVLAVTNIDWGGIGRGMIDGIISGITSAGGGIWRAVTNAVGNAGASVSGALGYGQSAQFAAAGQANTNNFAININGITGNPAAVAGASMDGVLSAARRIGK